jgi:hypothetical protein
VIPAPIRALALLAVLAGGFGVLGVAAPRAAAATPCAKKILEDWFDNSRVDRVYPLHCYREAIDAIPPDIRPYSNAADAIKQAWLAAGGRIPAGHKGRPQPGPVPIVPVANASSPSSLPLPLLVLGGMSLALLAAGGAGYMTRRRHAQGDSDEDDLT